MHLPSSARLLAQLFAADAEGQPLLFGELLKQAQRNLNAPWLGITGFVVIAFMLSLLVFIGEAVRDAFDPRKAFK